MEKHLLDGFRLIVDMGAGLLWREVYFLFQANHAIDKLLWRFLLILLGTHEFLEQLCTCLFTQMWPEEALEFTDCYSIFISEHVFKSSWFNNTPQTTSASVKPSLSPSYICWEILLCDMSEFWSQIWPPYTLNSLGWIWERSLRDITQFVSIQFILQRHLIDKTHWPCSSI